MKHTVILLLAASASSTGQPGLMPEWAIRALDAGVVEPYVVFGYDVSDECALSNLLLIEAYPDDQWHAGDESDLLEIAARIIGPFDTASTHGWPLLKESTEIARFEPAHYESRAIYLNSDGRAMMMECVFEAGTLLYVNMSARDENGRWSESERFERSLSSFGSSMLRITFSNEE